MKVQPSCGTHDVDLRIAGLIAYDSLVVVIRRSLCLSIVLLLAHFPAAAASKGEPTLVFEEIAHQAGLRADIVSGGPDKKWIPEANGSGVAWLDYDNDGWMDLLIVNGSTLKNLQQILAGGPPPGKGGGVYLYRNRGNETFEDVTEKSGLGNPYWGTGANAADYDNDGNVDILITTIGRDLLYHNNGDGTFTEVGKASGLSQAIAWHTGSAFGDYDGDGNLDLYVAGYLDPAILDLSAEAPVCRWKGLPVFCGPRNMRGGRDILYHNNGNGTFTEVTKAAGVEDNELRHGFSVVIDDFNGDGKPDIFVANDSDSNYLYLNHGDGTFRESGLSAGVGVNGDGAFQANMGVAVGDYDGDGRLDLLTTTFEDSYYPLFQQGAPGVFEDVTLRMGLGFTTPLLGWGCGFADFDNDGKPALWIANGHVYPNVGETGGAYFQPIIIARNRGGRFVRTFAFPAVPSNSYRGAAAADFNNDGHVGLVVLGISGPPVLLANRTRNENAWIGLSLKATRHNREAIGARVKVQGCGSTQYQSVRNEGSYLSRDDPRPRFGLGSCKKVDRVVVTWPGGKEQVIDSPPINGYIKVVEPVGQNTGLVQREPVGGRVH